MGQIIDGKKISQIRRLALKNEIKALVTKGARTPHLAVVLVGDDEPSRIYVDLKEKACKACGFQSSVCRLAKETSAAVLKKTISQLNNDPSVDGILLQLPLPKHLDSFEMIELIDPAKDVDGLTVANQGFLAIRRPRTVPCTPKGILNLLAGINCEILGKRAVVVGRSQLVGAPIARLLDYYGATVSVVHSKTRNPHIICREAEILIVAAGSAHLVDSSWVGEGAVVIDVGIHHSSNGLTGDVLFSDVVEKASYITPVPGGVGPMTIVSLLENCFEAYQNKLS